MSDQVRPDEDKVYVSLDLGSESMAAYYEDLSGNGEMVYLQTRAATLLGQSTIVAAAQEIDYLTEELNGRRKQSPRLRNRISLRDDRQPQQLDETHANLLFQDKASYEQSLFSYFHTVTGWPPNENILPNPKILFQHQIKAILPRVRSNDGRNVNLSPETLIKHLILQVLQNFVLKSNELKDIES